MSYYDRRYNPNNESSPSAWTGTAHAQAIQARKAEEAAANAPSKEELQTRIVAVQKIAQRDWDRGFLESLSYQLAKGRTLSPKQVETLAKIEHRNSPEVQKQHAQWTSQWNDEKKKIINICAGYYKTAGYFTDLVENVLNNETFVPSEKQYKAMCENKYAKKVLLSALSEPVFPVGSLVSFRSTAPYTARHASPVQQAIVLRANAAPISSAAKGAKVYEVLPVGSPTSYIVQERHLKKMRGTKKK